MDVKQSSIKGRYLKKLTSKILSDWSAILITTTELQNLPSGHKNDGKKATVTVTGRNLPDMEGCDIRYFGTWYQHPKYDWQLNVNSYEVIPPENKSGLVKFLSSRKFPGVGPKIAQAIVDRYGDETINIIEKAPNKLLAIRGITIEKLGIMVESYNEMQSYSRLSVFLSPYGISSDNILKISQKYGKRAIERIESNPYILQGISGIGFKTCDKIAKGLNVKLDCYERIEGATLDRLKNLCDSTGNMYMDITEIVQATLGLLNEDIPVPPVDNTKLKNALIKMQENKKIVIRKDRDVYLYNYDQAEYNTVQKLLWLLEKQVDEKTKKTIDRQLDEYCNKNKDIRLSEKQKDAVRLSLKNHMSIITGGPGTGKSTIQSAIIAVYKEVFGGDITLMAPTGKAARRMAECTGEEASTIHSRLKIFEDMHDLSCSINSGLIIVDEVSMVDDLLSEKLMKAITSQTCHLILVGDIDQLPSVGPGSVLSELINSGEIPTTRLTEIFRQKDGGLIVDNALKVNQGNPDLVYDDDFQLITVKNEEEAKKSILEIYQKEVKERGIDNVALLSPLRKTQGRFICVSDELNKDLQNTINPRTDDNQGCTLFNREYRVEDRVMQWQNCETSSNGDIGVIKKIYEDYDNGITVEIEWDNGNYVKAHKEDLETIDLAYAMSVHKSQGSEYECVIIPMLSCQFSKLHKRNLLYTGITRAKKKVILVGDENCIKRTVAQADATKRNTLLKERILYNRSQQKEKARAN